MIYICIAIYMRDDLSRIWTIVRRDRKFPGAKRLKRTENDGLYGVWVILDHCLRVTGQIDTQHGE